MAGKYTEPRILDLSAVDSDQLKFHHSIQSHIFSEDTDKSSMFR